MSPLPRSNIVLDSSNDDNDPAKIDMNLLNSIRALSKPGKTDFLTTLIAMFLKRVPELVAAMEKALENADALAFEDAAHALKGNCGNLGATVMVGTCDKLEQIGLNGDLTKAPPLMTVLNEQFSDVQKTFEAKWMIKSAQPPRSG